MATLSKIQPSLLPEPGTVNWLNTCIDRAARGEFVAEKIVLNPGLASELLRRNPDNRGIKPTKVMQYANDMRSGRWSYNGEPIIVSLDGLLNDGQHRCAALVDANICLPVAFVFGATRESRLTVDQGAARGAGDYLQMQDIPNANASGTIARLVIAYEASGGQNIETKLVTNADVLARVASDDQIAAAAHYAVTTGKKAQAYIAGTMIGFCYYLFAEIDKADATAFLDGLCTGVNLKPLSPALTCREKLLTLSKARQPKAAVIFRAWNMYRRGVLKVKTNGLITTMPFPALG